jgi:hypothetical protein
VITSHEPTLLRKPASAGMLLVKAADAPRRFVFHLVAEKLDVTVDLEAVAEDRTQATVTVEGPWLFAYRRTLARRALNRLYALCQTAATL